MNIQHPVSNASTYKLKVKLGSAEFDAEGPEETVRSQFEQFLEIARMGKASFEEKGTEPVEEQLDNGEWDRAYLTKQNQVSLKLLPQGRSSNADAILLLIYGHCVLLEHESITSVELMSAAKQSGLRIDRIDRTLTASHKHFVIKGGSGKGSRYSLNNRGRSRAQEILEALFE